MMPIGTTFSRYKRLVHDLSAELGKEIDLVTEGAETELDKTVLDQLGDPLVHLIRNSLDYASWKDRKALAAAIRPIYTAANAEAAQAELDAFEAGPWGQKFPTVVAAWRRAWSHVIPFFAFPPQIRRVIYTTNAIESVNARLRKIIKTRGHFPSDDAATKLIWLALRNITADWGRAAKDWKEAMNQFAILYEDRFTKVAA
jgi:transposase-like protein